MNSNDLFLMFKSTGKIEYYLKYKELEARENDDKESRRNNSK